MNAPKHQASRRPSARKTSLAFGIIAKTIALPAVMLALLGMAPQRLDAQFGAISYVVTSTANTGDGTLRDAISSLLTNSTSPYAVSYIYMGTSVGTVALGSALPNLNNATMPALAIIGRSQGTTIQGPSNARIMQVTNTEMLFLENLTFRGTRTNATTAGAVIFANLAALEINTGRSGTLAFIDNQAGSAASQQRGGGAIIYRTLAFTGSAGTLLFSNNMATAADGRGGALASYASASQPAALFFDSLATRVIFTSNTAGGSGGGQGLGGAIYAAHGSVAFRGRVDFDNNHATSKGGAIYLGGDLEVNGNTTFTNNRAGDYGGAIMVSSTGALPTNATAGPNKNPILNFNASTGDILFQGNVHSTKTSAAANAIYYDLTHHDSITFNFNADAGRTIYFYDPISGTNTTISGTYFVDTDVFVPASSSREITVNKRGAGTVLFDTYATDIPATTTVWEGTFQLGNNAVFGASDTTGSFTLKSGAALVGSGTIQAGAITLESGVLFEVHDGGVLTLNSSASAPMPMITATLAGHGTIKTGADITATGISVGGRNTGTAQTLALTDNITLANGTVVRDLDLYSANASDQIAFGGNLARSGSMTIHFSSFASGTFTLMSWGGSGLPGTDTLDNVTLFYRGLALSDRYDASLSVNGNTLALASKDFKNLQLTWTGAENNIWKSSDSEAANWTDSRPNVENYSHNGDIVVFNDSASATARAITVDAASVLVSSMEVSGSGNYRFEGAGGIAATTNAGDLYAGSTFAPTGKLTKTGAGTLTFANTTANEFAGGIEILGGNVVATNNLRTPGAININNATLSSSGLLTGNITAQNGGVLSAAMPNAVAPSTLTLDGNLTLNNGAMRVNLPWSFNNDYISILGDLRINNGRVDIGAFTAGTFVIAGVGGSITGDSTGDITVTLGGAVSTRVSGTVALSGASLVLTTVGPVQSLKYLWAGGTSTWHDGVRTGGLEFISGDAIDFTAAQGSQAIGVQSTGITVSQMDVTGNADYTFTGGRIRVDANSAISPAFTPTGKLVKSGNGTLTLANLENVVQREVEVAGGSLLLENSSLASRAVNVYSGATFGGSGTVNTAGEGVNIHDGGTLRIGSNAGGGALNIDRLELLPGNITLDGSGTLLTTAIFGGAGVTLNKTGAGTVEVRNTLDIGALNIDAGTYTAIGAATSAFTIKSGTNGLFTTATTGNNSIYPNTYAIIGSNNGRVIISTPNPVAVAKGAAMRAAGFIETPVFENKGDLHIGRAADTASTYRYAVVFGDYKSDNSTLHLQIGSSGTNIVMDRLLVTGTASGHININFTNDGTPLPMNANWNAAAANPLPPIATLVYTDVTTSTITTETQVISGTVFVHSTTTTTTATTLTGTLTNQIDATISSNWVEDPDGLAHKYIRDANFAGWLHENTAALPAITGADAAAILVGKASITSLNHRFTALRPGETPHGAVLWANALSRNDRITSNTCDGAQARTQGLQVGGDLSKPMQILARDGFFSLGAFYDHAGQAMSLPAGASSTDTSAHGFGLYSVFRTSGWHANLMLRAGVEKYSIWVADRHETMKTSGKSLAASVGGGKPYELSNIWTIEPHAQLTYHIHSIDDLTDTFDRVFRYKKMDSLEARGGVRLSARTNWYGEVPVTMWARGSYLFELRGRSEVRVGGNSFKNDLNGGAALIDGGLVFHIGKRTTVNLSGAWYYGSVFTGFGFDGGIGISW